jgi:flagellar motor switch/type III secretory pathway protein FliN
MGLEGEGKTVTGLELATRKSEVAQVAGSDLAGVLPKTPWMMRIEEHPSWTTLEHLEVKIQVGVALKRFRVRDLLALKTGQVFESFSPAAEGVPVRIGELQLGWSEFEVLDQRLALRLTRLG